MSASLTQLIGGSFQDAEGNLIENGYLTLKLSQDASVAGVGTICSGIEITIQLDSNGNVASSTSTPPAANQFAWANGNLSPVNTFYKVTGYTAEGQRAFGPNNQQIGTGSIFNLDAWIPNTVLSWFPSVQTTTFEVNGSPSSASGTLNLEAGNNITLTDEGGGTVQIAASGGSASSLGGFWSAGLDMNTPLVGDMGAAAPEINANNQVLVYQFVLQSEWVISKVTSYLVSGGPSGTQVAFGIWSSDGNTKLLDSGPIAATLAQAATVISASFSPVTLPPNVYYFGVADNRSSGPAPTLITFLPLSGDNALAVDVLNQFTTKIGIAANPISGSGVLPATLGTLTPQTHVDCQQIIAAFFEV